MIRRLLKRFSDNPLATRVWLWVLVFGSVLALLFTCVQLWLEYREDARQFDLRINEVVHSALPSLANSIWAVDERNIRSLLEGIRTTNGVYYVSLITADDRVYTAGESPVIDGVKTRALSWPVVFNLPPEKWMGDLTVFLDPRALYARIWDRGVTILVSQSVKALLVAFFFLMVFRRFVSRHLEAMAEYARERDLETLASPLVLNRSEPAKDDELSRVVKALNLMRERIQEQARRLHDVEARLRQEQEETREAHRMRSLYLANMTHDIRTPMNNVLGYTNLLLERPLPDDVRDSVRVIHESAQLLLERVNDILDLSRLDAGLVEVEVQPFELRPLIQEVVRAHMGAADGKHLVLDYQIDDSLPPWVEGDAAKIRHILGVFTRNAVRYTQQGHVFVQAEFVDQEGDEWRVRFSVEDTGPGLSRDELKLVFREFYRPYQAGSDGGVGLSLSICKRLAETMGGNVGVSSREGDGATFWLELRLGKARVSLISETPHLPEGFRVLVYDPQALSLKTTVQQLKEWHADVEGVSHEEAFLRLLRNCQDDETCYHVIILDSLVASDQGGALIRRIRKAPSVRHVPVLVLATHAHRGDAELYRRLGADGYLSKEYRETSLGGVLIRLLEGEELFVTRFPSGDDPHQRQKEMAVGLRVLVVEDNPVNLMLARRLLEKCGCEVVQARTGQEGLARAQEAPYDMILLDCRLPDLDGPEVVRSLRQQPGPNQEVAIFALVAQVTESERARCVEAGVTAFLTKPIRYEELCEAVQKAGLLPVSPARATSD